MIIDFHTHIYPPAVAAKAIAGASGLLTAATDGTAAGLLRSMDAAGIARSVALTLVTNPEKGRQINHWRTTFKKITQKNTKHLLMN